jgi:hypothetical protein
MVELYVGLSLDVILVDSFIKHTLYLHGKRLSGKLMEEMMVSGDCISI